MCRKCKKDNETLDLILKLLVFAGLVAAFAVAIKILYDKYKEKVALSVDEDFDCNFECLDNDDLDCDCDNCIYNGTHKDTEEKVLDEAEAEAEEIPAEELAE